MLIYNWFFTGDLAIIFKRTLSRNYFWAAPLTALALAAPHLNPDKLNLNEVDRRSRVKALKDISKQVEKLPELKKEAAIRTIQSICPLTTNRLEDRELLNYFSALTNTYQKIYKKFYTVDMQKHQQKRNLINEKAPSEISLNYPIYDDFKSIPDNFKALAKEALKADDAFKEKIEATENEFVEEVQKLRLQYPEASAQFETKLLKYKLKLASIKPYISKCLGIDSSQIKNLKLASKYGTYIDSNYSKSKDPCFKLGNGDRAIFISYSLINSDNNKSNNYFALVNLDEGYAIPYCHVLSHNSYKHAEPLAINFNGASIKNIISREESLRVNLLEELKKRGERLVSTMPLSEFHNPVYLAQSINSHEAIKPEAAYLIVKGSYAIRANVRRFGGGRVTINYPKKLHEEQKTQITGPILKNDEFKLADQHLKFGSDKTYGVGTIYAMNLSEVYESKDSPLMITRAALTPCFPWEKPSSYLSEKDGE